ncbi:hypothetical protein D1AOALGA4SA_8901 [Olavius algarvensis Delta 1 endosymbiont]|nr:hypothetical protein D1AOALGA4SA_8901 [Olavius algarvensis Delta 1 endosymbiont]
MTKITNSKHLAHYLDNWFGLFVISNFEFVCHLVLVIWYFQVLNLTFSLKN